MQSFFSDSSSFYFFSSLLQGNAAILSILGVFLVFRVQAKSSAIEFAKEALLHYCGNPVDVPDHIRQFDGFDLKAKEDRVAELRKTNARRAEYFAIWLRHETDIQQMKSRAKYPTILLAASIGIFTFGLFFAAFLHSLPIHVEFLALLISAMLEAILLYVVVSMIFALMK